MAKQAWEMFGAELESAGVGTALDATALELLCTSYALYRDAAEQVAKGVVRAGLCEVTGSCRASRSTRTRP